MRSLSVVLIVVVVLAGHDAAARQAPAPAPVRPGQEPAPVPPPNYSYEPDGRRDPFVNLVDRGTDVRQGPVLGARPDGLPGVLVDEVVVRGIVQTSSGWIAMIGLPSGRSHTVRPGDRVMDGTVRAITAQAVVFMQEVDNPLSLEKQREVRKFLRGEVK